MPLEEAILATLADLEEEQARKELPQDQAAPAASGKRKKVTCDLDTIDIVNDFLSESDDSLHKADEILMAIEHEGVTPDGVNTLFRVFHTIKGVAGFLDLFEIIALAHTTETLLDRVRQGHVSLEGSRLDRVLDATRTLRKLLGYVRESVETGTELESMDIHELLSAIAAESDGSAFAPKEAKAEAAVEAHPG